ncbi:hypothetical protein AtNW77_Chr3g0217551 [Arabidopsis thaliana]|uniref:Uncharacterized protein n=5 Tax=Arabidopsis TaxID=3701 RepID=A0A384KZ20_ARATH|nr:hypothetical protein (DUF1442) [Arabidopsis thaliana]KAG7629230.1 hypothetical protein ISN45_At03g053830 [Arabidopsis thaliana x Arabidopsis arenosa]KAG7635145.1 hypothetical protein ISN44_As03g052660 [Arabidopsis suecica]AAM63709.1 unknown [Arabidopsis thaliana]ABE66031.1 unknown [Arabidopsis thaliana]AEE80107.1 hypothetical protein (DUF1442) [Arabidopsis thaliana]|eukprot:NP_191637.1 hypothetical protein (DUF1442) [Arabidopsis thaliana]
MRLVWSPETASNAYIHTVRSCKSYRDSSVAEFLSATAAGWNTRLIVETWSRGDPIATSVGLAVAAIHTCGRHVCIVPDEESRSEYEAVMRGAVTSDSTEVMVLDSAEDVVERISGVDFMVVDSKRHEFVNALGLAKTSKMGAVLVCKNATLKSIPGFKWQGLLRRGTRVVRSVFLPVGRGLEIVHVGASGGGNGLRKIPSRWIKHIDPRSGEEHLFKR